MGGARYPLSLLLLTVVSTNRGQDEESGLDSALDESEVMDNVLQSSNYERTFRVRVGIAATECYFFDLKKGNTINVEYMVRVNADVLSMWILESARGMLRRLNEGSIQ